MMREVIEARVEEMFEYIDKEFKRIHRSHKLPGGVVLTGGTAKLPGLVEFAKETLELPVRVGHWKHVPRVVDNLDEARFAPAAGLMILDMLLGPGQNGGFDEVSSGLLRSVKNPLNSIMKRFRRG
jgi:cell division protein FtsA